MSSGARQMPVITSYALVSRDEPRFAALEWHRVVLVRAHNIESARAAQRCSW